MNFSIPQMYQGWEERGISKNTSLISVPLIVKWGMWYSFYAQIMERSYKGSKTILPKKT